jgi:glutaredoxin 3
MSATKIIVYSATWCAFCHAAKEYFDKLGIAYEDRDIEQNAEYAEQSVSKSGQRGIPVIDIDGDIIVGFDRAKIDNAIKTHQLA